MLLVFFLFIFYYWVLSSYKLLPPPSQSVALPCWAILFNVPEFPFLKKQWTLQKMWSYYRLTIHLIIEPKRHETQTMHLLIINMLKRYNIVCFRIATQHVWGRKYDTQQRTKASFINNLDSFEKSCWKCLLSLYITFPQAYSCFTCTKNKNSLTYLLHPSRLRRYLFLARELKTGY